MFPDLKASEPLLAPGAIVIADNAGVFQNGGLKPYLGGKGLSGGLKPYLGGKGLSGDLKRNRGDSVRVGGECIFQRAMFLDFE